MANILQYDGAVLLWIQDVIRMPALTAIMRQITKLGNAGALWIVIALLLLIPKRTRRIGGICILSMLSSYLFNNLLLKNLFHRTRPYEVVHGLTRCIGIQHDFSFPSGHSATSFAAAVVIYRHAPKRYGIPVLLVAALIAFSRLYLGVHYPTDVGFGILSGVVIAIFTDWWMKKLLHRFAPDQIQVQDELL